MNSQNERKVRVEFHNHLDEMACIAIFNSSSSTEKKKVLISSCAVYTKFLEVQCDELFSELQGLDKNNPNDHKAIETICDIIAKVQDALALVSNFGDEPFASTNMDTAYALVNGCFVALLEL